MDHPFIRVAAVLAAAAVMGVVAVAARQPLIVGFIATGILVGPAGFGWVTGAEGGGMELGLLADLGIAVLLFLVGLKLDPKLVRSTGPVALATGLGQVLFTSVVGFGIALALGLEWLPALYVAVALTFSSTIIIVKLLSDKRELDDLHGRIAVGFLIVQDIVVVIALITIASIGAADSDNLSTALGTTLLKVAGFVGSVWLAMRFVLPRFLGWLSHNRELLLLFALSWAIALAGAAQALEFSAEVGSFLAGFALASTPYREAIASRLIALRDFLLLFFFIQLGAELELEATGALFGEALVLSVFVLIGNPLIVLAIMGAMGYRARTAFLAGLTVAQISEFSLILVALGLSFGHVDRSILGLVTTVGLITIGLSTYMILYSGPIHDRIGPWLKVFERKKLVRAELEHDASGEVLDAIVIGLGRHGRYVAESLLERGRRVLGVDIDPDALEASRRAGMAVLFGDASEPELCAALPLEHARWVISTVPRADAALALVHGLRAVGYRGQVVMTAHAPGDEARFKAAGADVVLTPYALAADHLLDQVCGRDGAQDSG